MIATLIAVIVAAFAGGVVGWIAGVAKGMTLMERALFTHARELYGDDAADRLVMRLNRGRLDR